MSHVTHMNASTLSLAYRLIATTHILPLCCNRLQQQTATQLLISCLCVATDCNTICYATDCNTTTHILPQISLSNTHTSSNSCLVRRFEHMNSPHLNQKLSTLKPHIPKLLNLNLPLSICRTLWAIVGHWPKI